MRNPIQRLRDLPWRSLLQVAGLILLMSLILDGGLAGLLQADWAKILLLRLLMPPLDLVIWSIALPLGWGVLAAWLYEWIDRSTMTTSSLWGLVLCLFLASLVRLVLPVFSSPLPPLLGFEGLTQVVLIAVGIFWKGRRYWQVFQRW